METTDTLGPYKLNRIYVGDARELGKAIPDEGVDLVLTDPPYGIGFQYSHGYKDDPENYLDLVQWIVQEGNRVVKPGCLCFVFQAMPRLRETWPLFPEGSRIFAACKNFVQIRPVPVQFAWDPVVFWQKPGQYPKKASGRDWHVGNTSNTSNRGLNEAGFHSCPRPLDTIVYMVDNFCPPGGVVLDWFMGSGTTAVAAKITGRKFIGFEIDPQIAKLAQKRVDRAPLPLLAASSPEQLHLI